MFWLTVQNSWIQNLAYETTLKFIPENDNIVQNLLICTKELPGFQS